MPGLPHVLDRPEPTIAAPFTSSNEVLSATGYKGNVDVAELRADFFPDGDYVAAAAHLLRVHMPVLLTPRHTSEAGGRGGISDDGRRIKIYEGNAANVDGMDVEIRSAICHDVIDLAHAAGGVAIASFHNFETTPELSELDELLDEGLGTEADCVKFALRANSWDDLCRQAEFLLANREYPLIMVAMDNPELEIPTRFGAISRSIFSFLGSRMIYAALAQVVAPGQLSAADQAEIFRLMGVRV